jgi:hypothetical protein
VSHPAIPTDCPIKAVVIGYASARRQRASLRGDALDRPPEIDLGLEQAVTRATVLARLARKADVRICRQRG